MRLLWLLDDFYLVRMLRDKRENSWAQIDVFADYCFHSVSNLSTIVDNQAKAGKEDEQEVWSGPQDAEAVRQRLLKTGRQPQRDRGEKDALDALHFRTTTSRTLPSETLGNTSTLREPVLGSS